MEEPVASVSTAAATPPVQAQSVPEPAESEVAVAVVVGATTPTARAPEVVAVLAWS